MEINTKYDIGQEVWFDYQGIACWEFVEKIVIEANKYGNVIIQYVLGTDEEIWLTEDLIYATREEWEKKKQQ